MSELPEELPEMFEFLDDLRESGETNMFGARPYLVNEFAVPGDVAGAVLSAWMKSFDNDIPPLDRALTILAEQSANTPSITGRG